MMSLLGEDYDDGEQDGDVAPLARKMKVRFCCIILHYTKTYNPVLRGKPI